MNLDPDFREIDEPVVTISMGKRAAEWVSAGLSDQLCWCNGFNAALNPSEDHDRRPMGMSQMRELNIALKRAIERAEK
jgi:hypothetical protein